MLFLVSLLFLVIGVGIGACIVIIELIPGEDNQYWIGFGHGYENAEREIEGKIRRKN